jgi:hypothetical protein
MSFELVFDSDYGTLYLQEVLFLEARKQAVSHALFRR